MDQWPSKFSESFGLDRYWVHRVLFPFQYAPSRSENVDLGLLHPLTVSRETPQTENPKNLPAKIAIRRLSVLRCFGVCKGMKRS